MNTKPQIANPPLAALLERLIAMARRYGADGADAMALGQSSLAVSYRLGKREDIDRAESLDLSLRVFVGRRQAFVSSSDTTADALDAMAARAIAMAQAAPEDPYACLAPRERLWTGGDAQALELADPAAPDAEALFALARAAEEAALAVPGVTNSEGAGASWSRRSFALATSHGFMGERIGTHYALGASVLAGEGSAMQRDYDYVSARHAADLEPAATVGRRAGERAVRRLGPCKIKTKAMPLVFDPRVGNSLLGHFAAAINGQAIARGTSFLRDSLHAPVFAADITVIDDPLRRRGLASRPFDGEGVACAPLSLVEDGVLRSWLLDSASAAQLGLETTGHAARSGAGAPAPAPSNLYLAAGAHSRDALLGDIAEGLYVTELIGMGVNGVTGDYSRGAAGFLIEKGEIAGAVSEVTVAGNLRDMFRNLSAADDLAFRYRVNVPTLRIDGMMVAGA